MPVTADKPAPYAPGSAVLDVIERHRSRGFQTINAEVLGRAGVAQSLIPRVLQSLHTLDLVNPETGAPTPVLEAIRVAPEIEYRPRLAEWLRGAYADVFAFVDPTTDDETRIRDAFRSYYPVGQQSRMVALFQALCSAAGLAPDKTVVPRPPARSATPRSTPAKAQLAAMREAAARASNAFYPGSATAKSLPPALQGLIASIPDPGAGWTQVDRDKFLRTFGAVLDFCIPIKEPTEANENGGQP